MDGGSEQQSISLGVRLQQARKSSGLTQQQLCQKAKLAYSTLAKIERGAIKSPSIFTIQSIAEVLGVSVDTLLGVDSPTPLKQKKISQHGVRFVYFDINGCLVRFFHRAFVRIAAETHASPEKIEATFWHYNDRVCKGQLSMDEFNQAMAKGIGIESFDWQRYYLEAIEPIPEMHEVVTWAAQHYQVGLLSNIMPGLITEMKKHKLLPDIEYAAIVDSSEVGAIKPDPKIFTVALERSGFGSQAVMLVDDDRTNVMAAEKAGWHVLWFDDFRAGESAKRVKRALAF